jgi:hypothetical protein
VAAARSWATASVTVASGGTVTMGRDTPERTLRSTRKCSTPWRRITSDWLMMPMGWPASSTTTKWRTPSIWKRSPASPMVVLQWMLLMGWLITAEMGRWNVSGWSKSTDSASRSVQMPTGWPFSTTTIELQRWAAISRAASRTGVSGGQLRISFFTIRSMAWSEAKMESPPKLTLMRSFPLLSKRCKIGVGLRIAVCLGLVPRFLREKGPARLSSFV